MSPHLGSSQGHHVGGKLYGTDVSGQSLHGFHTEFRVYPEICSRKLLGEESTPTCLYHKPLILGP